MQSNLLLHKNQHLRIEGIEYVVIGGIEFCNETDHYKWSEYCLQTCGTGQLKWLSVDNLYEEYAIYTTSTHSSEFMEENIFQDGYREADSGNAAVTGSFGKVDTEPGDTVTYTEYEDSTEEYIMAVERWEDETEYSRGYYLDLNEIELLGDETDGQEGLQTSSQSRTPTRKIKGKTLRNIVVVLVVLGVVILLLSRSNKNQIQKYLKESEYFTYQTSITSDLNNKEKADVFTSALSVDSSTKLIIDAIRGETESVQENEEDDSVAILTKYEYCLVYTSTDHITTIQISSRAYVYQSTNAPYRSTPFTHSYYRGFYYYGGFGRDRDRYSSAASGFDSYKGAEVRANPDDPYRSYSDSVRQNSINSRRSSGGGISSGK